MSGGYEETVAQLQTALQVRHIAHTPLTTIAADATPAHAQAMASRLTLNNLPVVDADDGIIGVLENVNGEVAPLPQPRGDVRFVKFAMRPLSDRMVVESGRSLDGFVDELLAAPYYQLVVTEGRVDGIVTASDLNKAPVRVLAYAAVAHLETAMTAAIRARTGQDDNAAVAELGRDASEQVRSDHRKLLRATLNADLLDATTFKQKAVILAGLEVFEPHGNSSVDEEFGVLYERLRNPIMHMSPFVAESLEGLRDFASYLGRVNARTREALAVATCS